MKDPLSTIFSSGSHDFVLNLTLRRGLGPCVEVLINVENFVWGGSLFTFVDVRTIIYDWTIVKTSSLPCISSTG